MEITNVEKFLRYCRISKGMQENTTIKQYRNDIYEFCEIVGIKDDKGLINLKPDQIDIYLEELYKRKYSNASYNKRLSTLKSLYNYFELEDIVVKNVFRKYNTKKIKPKPKVYLTLEDGYKLVKYAKNERDELFIKFCLQTGVRVSEITSIKLEDIKWKTNEILIRRKGGKQQLLVVPENIMVDVNYYINHYRTKQLEKLRKTNEELPYLFISFRGNKMNTNCLNTMIKTTARKAGIENWDKIHNHTMRTTYATQMHKAGVSDKAIQLQLGHNSISTTMNSYVQVDNEQIRAETQGKGFNFSLETKETDYQKKIKYVVEQMENSDSNLGE